MPQSCTTLPSLTAPPCSGQLGIQNGPYTMPALSETSSSALLLLSLTMNSLSSSPALNMS
ncbi:hypothetical protein [Cohnella rhizosphaerae]|uniref:Uncharacterized protein n=1 Tax=Cohnella rhizosphaerae TaxID=1457232 RepID=A0A9X4KQL0_9BACL|nr:hypothetical protein [Cohnella rhizosphaerae]MDG0808863.1 hypothetical protein [Cohnella rhizosphaerae]